MKSKKTTWHSQSPEALATSLRVDIQQGLNELDAQQRLDQYGVNRLTPRRGKSPLRCPHLLTFHCPDNSLRS